MPIKDVVDPGMESEEHWVTHCHRSISHNSSGELVNKLRILLKRQKLMPQIMDSGRVIVEWVNGNVGGFHRVPN